MKLALTISSIDQFKKIKNKNIDEIIIGIKNYSCRFNGYFDIDQLKDLQQINSNKKIIVCLNDIYFEHQIKSLTNLIKELVSLNINAIMFHDFSIPQIIKENNLKINIHYSPETIVTNYGQFDFYKKNNINNVTIATELTINEIKKVCENKQDTHIYIKGHGLGFVMHSRWPMISNFEQHLNDNKKLVSKKFNDIDYLLIKEQTRKLANIIFEDKSGTHMMTGYYICSIKKIQKLISYGLDVLIIDSLFIDDELLLLIVDLYIKAINDIDEKYLENYFDEIKSKSEYQISEGFFGNIADRLHMIKEENYE